MTALLEILAGLTLLIGAVAIGGVLDHDYRTELAGAVEHTCGPAEELALLSDGYACLQELPNGRLIALPTLQAAAR